jgi:hypothetical protein
MSLFRAGGAQVPRNLLALCAATDANPQGMIAQREHMQSLWHASASLTLS